MGIKATVVYDAPHHTVVVLRTESNNVINRYSILETVSSFTQHCDSLRGVANTVTQVCALRGDPPYIDYTVVGSRFCFIVVRDEETAQFDLSYDVHNAMKRFESAIFNVAEALEARSVDLLLRFMRQLVTHTNEPKKKNSLFGRIGSALKSSSDSVKKNIRQEALSTAPSEASPSAALFGSKAALDSAALFGSQAALDSGAGDLHLPGTVFKWTYFAPLQSEESDLKWFVDLIRGQGVEDVGADLPKLRGNVSTQLIFLGTDSANPDT
ncbi:hypothetical protein BWQ96_09679 [Gracilariopsis chorda]|uniref:Uncharacterized protein n=1 Tax=Gracilariopsis chorda TaxID=448386 RepID=A0A2V3IEW2_9FLOR|nr:hypothetical protein BWQ96_09679 [Gracilariopsis chorda]|eukprot:PXF40607.1 hypothetical protein BWQ96_09679 [Gracilariopsis chorda]